MPKEIQSIAIDGDTGVLAWLRFGCRASLSSDVCTEGIEHCQRLLLLRLLANENSFSLARERG